jgi:hypothetical protein
MVPGRSLKKWLVVLMLLGAGSAVAAGATGATSRGGVTREPVAVPLERGLRAALATAPDLRVIRAAGRIVAASTMVRFRLRLAATRSVTVSLGGLQESVFIIPGARGACLVLREARRLAKVATAVAAAVVCSSVQRVLAAHLLLVAEWVRDRPRKHLERVALVGLAPASRPDRLVRVTLADGKHVTLRVVRDVYAWEGTQRPSSVDVAVFGAPSVRIELPSGLP